MIIDTHCHVHFRAYKDDMHEVIKRSLDKGVAMITVGTQKDTSKKGLEIAEQYDNLWATVGIHPNHLCKQDFIDDQELDPEDQQVIKTRCETYDHETYLALAQHPKCVAIGEFGLDYFHIPEGLDRDEVIVDQKKNCRLHFDLATEANLPVALHTRDAHDEQLEIIREYIDQNKLQQRGVVHCFTGTLKEAMAYIDLGFMISVTGIVTFKARAKERLESGLSPLQDMARQIPLESLMIETDAPYISPEPLRGKRNEPWHVIHIAKKIAELKNISYEEVSEATTKNAERMFGIKIK